jgi:IS5 family transposase
MLTLWSGRAECLWEDALPIEVKQLPGDLAALDRLLDDPELVMPILERFGCEVVEDKRLVLTEGRPTIAMQPYIRLMVLKQRYRWGYRTLVAEVSDSIHLRRFCRISILERVPDESTIRKMTRRLGAETVAEMTRSLITSATREKRFVPRAVRIDSTVIEADIKHPTDAGLASAGVLALARESQAGHADQGEALTGPGSFAVDGTQAGGDRADDPPAHREGQERGSDVDQGHGWVVGAFGRGGAPACLRGAQPGARARRASQAQGGRRAGRVGRALREGARQIRQRVAGEKITDRIVSLTDPDARPIRKGKIGKPTEFGYVSQLAEVTEHTRSGARGLILPASHQVGNPSENTLLPSTIAELQRLGITPREVAVDGGFQPTPTNAALADLAPGVV